MYIETNLWENVNRNVDNKSMGKGIAAYQNFMPEGSNAFGVQKEKYEKLAEVTAAGSVNMADATYRNPMMPDKDETVAEEIMAQGQQSAQGRANEMAVIANTTSPEDLKKMSEQGFSVTESDSRTIITVTDKIKAALAKAGVDVSAFGDSLTKEQLEQITGNPAVVNQIMQTLEANDLPTTDANVEESVAALEQASTLTGLSDDAMGYLLKNGLEPTIHNVYMAEHAGTVAEENRVSTVTAENLKALEPQIAAIIEEAGLAVDDETLADGKWLIEHQIPLTADNLVYLKQMKELSTQLSDGTYDWNGLTDSMAKAISSGKRPEDAYMITARRKLEETRLILTTEARSTMEKQGIVIDTKPLEALVEDLKVQEREYYRALLLGEGIEASEENIDIFAQTEEAFADLKTAPAYVIGQVDMGDTVEMIHGAGEMMRSEFAQTGESYEPMLAAWQGAGLQGLMEQAGGDLQVELQRETVPGEGQSLAAQADGAAQMEAQGATVQSVAQNAAVQADAHESVQTMPQSAAAQTGMQGVAAQTDSVQAVPQSASAQAGEGMQVQAAGTEAERTAPSREFVQMSERYETVQTAPRADMGDSIQKAFRNVDDILTDMDLEPSEFNRRAVRILSYNETEITEENIQAVKAMDEEMQRAFKNMTPAVTLELIRRGENPLDMTLDQLNRTVEQIKAETGHEEQERFSKFLWKLEQDQEISAEERDSYIGIYRLIAQVEKTDGAALGFLMNQGSEPTMRNILTAMRSRKKGGMDYSVDDDFDGVKGTAKGPRIDDQIEAAFQQNCLKDVLDAVTPEKLARLGNENWESMTPEQLAAALQEMEASVQEEQADKAYAKEQLEAYRQVLETSEEVYSYLEHYELPNSVVNVLAAADMLRRPNQVLDRLWKKGEDAFAGSSREIVARLKQQVLEAFGEALHNPEDLADAQEKLADVAEHVMDGMLIEDPTVRSLDVRELRRTVAAFELCAKKAQEECYMVPIQTGDSVTGVSLKIVRGREKKGWVDILFESARGGKVAASFRAKDKGISGMIAVDNEQSRKILSEHLDALVSAMQGESDEAGTIDVKVAYSADLSLEKYELAGIRREEKMEAEGELAEDRSDTVQTTRLYHIAESFIRYSSEYIL